MLVVTGVEGGEGVNLPVLAGTSGLFLLIISRTHQDLPDQQHQGIRQRVEAIPFQPLLLSVSGQLA